jgi:hypothetical protein
LEWVATVPRGIMCRIWYSISRTVSDDDAHRGGMMIARSALSPVKPRACGAPQKRRWGLTAQRGRRAGPRKAMIDRALPRAKPHRAGRHALVRADADRVSAVPRVLQFPSATRYCRGRLRHPRCPTEFGRRSRKQLRVWRSKISNESFRTTGSHLLISQGDACAILSAMLVTISSSSAPA